MSNIELLKEQIISEVSQETSEAKLLDLFHFYQDLQMPMTPELRARIEEGIRKGEEDIAAGRVYSHEEVMERMQKRFGFPSK